MSNIHFLGQLSDEDKVTLLILCYAIFSPSHLRSEAFGVLLLEGAMFGKLMISCEIGKGTTFINIAGETGLVEPPSDPLALRQAIQFIWEQPEQTKKWANGLRKVTRSILQLNKWPASRLIFIMSWSKKINQRNPHWRKQMIVFFGFVFLDNCLMKTNFL